MASPKYRVWFHLTAAAHEEPVPLGSPQPRTTRLATPKIKRGSRTAIAADFSLRIVLPTDAARRGHRWLPDPEERTWPAMACGANAEFVELENGERSARHA
jgi:hypothetical protein